MQNLIILKTPASFWGAPWREALPSGNGRIGAAVYGGVGRERILLTHEDLWTGSRTALMPDVSGQLPRVRRLLRAGRSAEAEPVLADALRGFGYDPQIGTPLPLGDLIVTMPARQAFRDYTRTLDMGSGEVVVRWRDGDTRYERALFVSRPDDLIVCEIRADGPDGISAALTLDLHDRADARSPDGGPDAPLPCERAHVRLRPVSLLRRRQRRRPGLRRGRPRVLRRREPPRGRRRPSMSRAPAVF